MGTIPKMDLGGNAEHTVVMDGQVYTVGGTMIHEDGGAPMRKPDFSGWATKAGLRCTDGRTIMPDAFKHQNETSVPLVWKHNESDMSAILGYVDLKHQAEGVRCDAYFNSTAEGQRGKILVHERSVRYLSIHATGLTERQTGNGSEVHHGHIVEVSLVPAGANPGAVIDNLEIKHSVTGEWTKIDDEAIIFTGLELEHAGSPAAPPKEEPKTEDEGPTGQQVYESMSQEQKDLAHYMVAEALAKKDGGDATHQQTPGDGSSLQHTNNDGEEPTTMKRSVFDQTGGNGPGSMQHQAKTQGGTMMHDGVLYHVVSEDEKKEIVGDALAKNSAKGALEAFALKHGIHDINLLFPDAKTISTTPEWDKRRTEWVSKVLNGTRHTPFAKIKSIIADITHEEARARGYITGSFKKEEWIRLAMRTTGPGTIYKKQKMDRDNVIDITDFDVIAWIQGEMRLMLEEEVARAILISDGRELGNPDKIPDPEGAMSGDGIRSILKDNELYAATVNVNIDDANSDGQEVVEAIMYGAELYKGSGSPDFFTTQRMLTWMLLAKDKQGRRYYNNVSELAAAMGVSSIVPVEVMYEVPDVVGIYVNLSDYNIGTNRGGEITSFQDFDLNYNQELFLLETRLSGALVKIRSAIVFKKTVKTLAKPEKPGYNPSTGAITIKDTPNVIYKDGNTTVTSASTVTVPQGGSKTIKAFPATGYYFFDNITDEFTFDREAA